MRSLLCLALAGCISATKVFPRVNDTGLCGNGQVDDGESDVDCGGEQCERCVVGASCNSASDCDTGLCEGNICQATRCDDGKQGVQESDVDCGGACAPCGVGRACFGTNDCAYSRCIGRVCESTVQTLEVNTVEQQLGAKVDYDGSVLAAAAIGATSSVVIFTQGTSGFAQGVVLSVADLHAIAVGDNTLFVGASGRVDLYTGPQSLPANASPAGALGASGSTGFGALLAHTPNTLAVGAEGRVHLFNRTATGWAEQAQIEGAPEAIALADDTVAIAGNTTVAIFTRRGTTWSLQQQLVVTVRQLALAGNELLAATAVDAKLFLRTGSAWALAASFPGEASSVALTAGAAAVAHAGTVRLFYGSGTTWLPAATSTLSGQGLGASMAMTRSLLVLGAPGENPIGGGLTRGEVLVLGDPSR